MLQCPHVPQPMVAGLHDSLNNCVHVGTGIKEKQSVDTG